jgi:23S rRNA (pseudouridine1915-N3)-methyltransferase
VKILLLFVGKTKNQNLHVLIKQYVSRVRHFCDLTVSEIRAVDEPETSKRLAKEGESLLASIRPGAYVMVLDPTGDSLASKEFASLIEDLRGRSLKDLVFVIGSHDGLSDRVKSRANKMLSLSAMTFNHEVARLVLLEQIYRAFTLIHHFPYHK